LPVITSPPVITSDASAGFAASPVPSTVPDKVPDRQKSDATVERQGTKSVYTFHDCARQ